MKTLTNISLLKHMYNYQTKFNITKQCVANTMFYTDMINIHFPTEKCIPNVGIMHYYDTSINKHIQVNHCWCLLNGNIIDPSIEYVKLPYKKTYHHNLKEYFEFLKKQPENCTQEHKLLTIQNTCKLQKMLNQFVNNFKSKTDYYEEIRDYIKDIYTKKQKRSK